MTSWLNFWESIGKNLSSLDAHVRPRRSLWRPLSFFLSFFSPTEHQSEHHSCRSVVALSFKGSLVNIKQRRCDLKLKTFTQSHFPLPEFYYLSSFSTLPLLPLFCPAPYEGKIYVSDESVGVKLHLRGAPVLIRAPGHSPNLIWTYHFSVAGLEVG